MARPAGEDDPGGRVGVGGHGTAYHQGQGDDAHRLLRVVGAVGEGDQAGLRGDLARAVALGRRLAVGLLAEGVGEAGREHRRDARDDRCRDRRDQHLGDQGVTVHRAHTGRGDGGADQTAHQGVRGTGGQAHQPGQEVPEDRADQGGEDDLGTDAGLVDETLGDRVGDLHREESSHKVERGGHGHRNLGLECTGRDGGGHRVGGVVETVREIERECGNDHNREDQREVFHLPRQSFEVIGALTVSNLGERKMNWEGHPGVCARGCGGLPSPRRGRGQAPYGHSSLAGPRDRLPEPRKRFWSPDGSRCRRTVRRTAGSALGSALGRAVRRPLSAVRTAVSRRRTPCDGLPTGRDPHDRPCPGRGRGVDAPAARVAPGVERGRRGPAVDLPAAAIVYETRGLLPARALVRPSEAVRAAERRGGGPRCLLAGSPHG